MKALEDKILQEGTVLPGNILKVGSFLNQRIDVELLMQMGQETARLFKDEPVTCVLTIEASGIAFAVAIAAALHVPAVFAKKNRSENVSGEVYSTIVHSYTHNRDYNVIVPKGYITSQDHVLIADDFLANGCAVNGLIDLVSQAGASLTGVVIEIEKGFQDGGRALREQGVHLESLTIVESMEDGKLKFAPQSV